MSSEHEFIDQYNDEDRQRGYHEASRTLDSLLTQPLTYPARMRTVKIKDVENELMINSPSHLQVEDSKLGLDSEHKSEEQDDYFIPGVPFS